MDFLPKVISSTCDPLIINPNVGAQRTIIAHIAALWNSRNAQEATVDSEKKWLLDLIQNELFNPTTAVQVRTIGEYVGSHSQLQDEVQAQYGQCKENCIRIFQEILQYFHVQDMSGTLIPIFIQHMESRARADYEKEVMQKPNNRTVSHRVCASDFLSISLSENNAFMHEFKMAFMAQIALSYCE
jgi:capsule polysaccharide modification protein KpsS